MHLTEREFERIVSRALDSLADEVHELLDNVDILVDDWPSPEQLDITQSETKHDMLGLYEGISLRERGHYDMVLPDKITLFRRPILETTSTVAEVEAEVRLTLLHEIAHYLGWDEEEMERLGVE